MTKGEFETTMFHKKMKCTYLNDSTPHFIMGVVFKNAIRDSRIKISKTKGGKGLWVTYRNIELLPKQEAGK